MLEVLLVFLSKCVLFPEYVKVCINNYNSFGKMQIVFIILI